MHIRIIRQAYKAFQKRLKRTANTQQRALQEAWFRTFVLVGKSSRHPPLVVYLNSTYMAISYCGSLGYKTWQIAYQNAQIISYKLVASTQVAEWFSCLAVEAVEFAALKPLLLKLQSLHSLLP